MYLDQTTFSKVVESTPLISIDLVVESSEGHFLLGLRNNRPAQGYWFVPGGRVLKGESLDNAFQRLCQEELGMAFERSSALFLGTFEHFYEDSVFGEGISTHYIVLGYTLQVDFALDTLPKQQHNLYRWFTRDEMLEHDKVHIHSKWYLSQ
ncbi:GDP-mannose mannosyl hydrolase [Marinomonas sp. GJ51-6]|uniref:GDP-mannose mannosyl hydrolase n=1 Tax=Marinomonas sp. GJ51-6 TaxID=2992802 RepID=UPI002934A4FF|nr:GDP-mannose mannosyl hydrolase [Marinomonas sp. GJ51-6]WOD06192.1 GDP-mannose mannosyl hydrolase [Marinomonas sp. GJ51-6]